MPKNIHNITRVHKLRTTLDISQKQLAKQSVLEPYKDFPPEAVSAECRDQLAKPLSWDTIWRLEEDEREKTLDRLFKMSVGNFLKLCKGLGIKPQDLWPGWPC